MKQNVALFLVTALLLFSCRKEEDRVSPKVRITGPGEFTQFQLPATISISGEVSDDVKITGIELSITSPEGTIVAQTTIDPQTNPISFTRNFQLSNPILSGGDYLIRLRASDGHHHPTAFRTIRIYPVPLAVDRIFITVKETGGTRLCHLNGAAIENDWLSGLDTRQMDISPREQLILLRGSNLDVEGIEASGTYRRFLLNGVQAQWIGFDENRSRFFLTNNTTSCITYNRNGVNVETHNTPYMNAVVNGAAKGTNHRYFFNTNTTTIPGSNFLELIPLSGFYFGGNAYPSGMKILNAWEITTDQLLLVGQDGADIELKQFLIQNNQFTLLNTIPGAVVRDVVRGSEDLLIISSSVGIYAYQISTNALLQVATGDTRSADWDPVSGTIYRAIGNELEQLTFPTGSTVQSWTASDSIRQVRILLNR